MTRHPFRWSSLAFGLLFLAGVGQWAVWKQDILTPRELSLTASGVLIALGILGIIATLWKPRKLTATTTEGPEDEEIDPQP